MKYFLKKNINIKDYLITVICEENEKEKISKLLKKYGYDVDVFTNA
jgi:hypothetical protein